MLERFLNYPFFYIEFWNNSVIDYINAIVIFIALLIILKIFQVVILKRLQYLALKTKTDIDDTLIEIIQSLKPPFYSFLAFYLALFFLEIDPLARKAINAILIIWVTFQAIKALQILINYIFIKRLAGEKEKETAKGLEYVSTLVKITLWVLGALVILSNLGINITSLIAGLGIGGIAIALALQNILGDLFSSLAIFFDKPFVVGDFIVVGENRGTVEKIGIKTTRIRSLDGEEIIISNQELIKARIQNFKTVKKRRALFKIGVVYGTPLKKLKTIPKLIEEAVNSVELTKFDRANFVEYADFSLNFEVSFYVETENYKKFLDTKQAILFKIKELFEKEKIEMAFPTQTVYLAKE